MNRRTVFLIPVTMFGAASVLGAVLSNEFAHVALRFPKGVSAGFTVSAGLSFLAITFAEGPARNRALGIYTLCAASGFALGLGVSGLLTEIGWRATLLLPGPVALLLVLAGWWALLHSTRGVWRTEHFDLAGALSATGAMLVLVYAVVEARSWPSLATIAALLATIVAVKRRHGHPLIRLAILRNPALVHPNLGALARFASYVAFQFIAALYVQDALGWSPIAMALAFLPPGIIIVLSGARIGAIIERLRTDVTPARDVRVHRRLCTVPADEPVDALRRVHAPDDGADRGRLRPQLHRAQRPGDRRDRHHEQGLASGLLNASLQLGGAVVLPAATAILHPTGAPIPEHLLPAMTTAVEVVVGVTAGASLLALMNVDPTRCRGRSHPPGPAGHTGTRSP